MQGIVRHNDNRFPRSPEQANATNRTVQAQLIAAQLTEPMRRALLSAQPACLGEPTWDNPLDYCPGHESLRGDCMGTSYYCEDRPCHDAVTAYNVERRPDPDTLHIKIDHSNKIGTVNALADRALCLDGQAGNDHKLTDLGYDVRAVLVDLQPVGWCPNPWHASAPSRATQTCPECPTKTGSAVSEEQHQDYTREQRMHANAALRSAKHAYRFATEGNRMPAALAEAVAAALDCVAAEGDTSPETLRAIARALKAV